MSAKTYWNLLVLFGVVCQGIIGTFPEKDIDESSELLVRQKRAGTSQTLNLNINDPITTVPYVVLIKTYRRTESCVGTILSNRIVLTAASCVDAEVRLCRVYAGTARKSNIGLTTYKYRLRVTDKRVLMIDHLQRPEEGIALITVTPSVTNSLYIHNIPFHEEPIHSGIYGTVSGWECDSMEHPQMVHSDELRSISVRILNRDQCATIYTSNFSILQSEICTVPVNVNQLCGIKNAGAPLVTINNHLLKLVGVKGSDKIVANRNNSVVFINLQYPRHKNWIEQTIHILNHNRLR